MRDNYNCSTFEEVFKCSCHSLFTVTIESSSRFVEEYNFGIFEKNLCNSEALLLSPTETDSSLSDFGFYAIFEFIDKLTLSELNSFFHFFFTYFSSSSIEEIFFYSSVEYRWFLSEVSDMRIITIETNSGNILTINE